jgi:hypothetical protein
MQLDVAYGQRLKVLMFVYSLLSSQLYFAILDGEDP